MPPVRIYLWTAFIAVSAWIMFYFGMIEIAIPDPAEKDLYDMHTPLRTGILSVLGTMAIGFAVHWGIKASSSAMKSSSVSLPATSMGEEKQEVESQQFTLEVRGAGLVTDRHYQTEVWSELVKKSSNHASILSQNVEDYSELLDLRQGDAELAAGAAFGFAARQAVEQWPIPVFILGPPKFGSTTDLPALIAFVRQKAGLGVHLFLWQDDANTTNAQSMLERLFVFFDKHPDVPAALIYSMDGTVQRDMFRERGTPRLKDGFYVPALPDSYAALLVTRTDRVDRLMRPYIRTQTGAVDKTTTQFDVSKLWNFYWKQDRESYQAYKNQAAADNARARLHPTTVAAGYWQNKLPELWSDINNKGPGNFTPSPYLPVRWTDWQLREFDNAPVLGYLHRPVRISLTDNDGDPLKRNEQVKALQTGWQESLETLAKDEKPKRVFYDTSDDSQWIITLTQALHKNRQGIDLGNVNEGFDIGRRIGNTGVSSALVQINLALMAGYQQGGTSATINLSPDGYAGILMVSPPDEATKMANTKRRGSNPFVSR